MKRSPQFWILAVFFLSALAMAVSVQAQPRRPGGGPGRPGGPGGPAGFGAFGQRPGGLGGDALGLLRSETARTEAGVDEATAEKARTAAGEAMRQGREGMGDFREMSREERQKAFEKMHTRRKNEPRPLRRRSPRLSARTRSSG